MSKKRKKKKDLRVVMSTHPTGIFLFFSKQLQAFIISLEKEIETFQIFLQ